MTHGMSEEQVDKIIDELNDFLSNKKEEEFSDEVTLTDAAVNKVKSLMKAENKEGFALRIGVVSGGCSGMSYELSFVGKAEKNDLHREKNGLKIYLEKADAERAEHERQAAEIQGEIQRERSALERELSEKEASLQKLGQDFEREKEASKNQISDAIRRAK